MAAGSTYTPIATTTLGSAATTIDFTSISGSYTDLVLVLSYAQNGGTARWVTARVNSDSGTNYSNTRIEGNGTSASSGRDSTQSSAGLHFTVNNTAQSNCIINFQNYSNTSTYKTFLARGNTPSAGLDATVALWRSTAAITSISLGLEFTAQFAVGTQATLYGIQAA